MLQKFLTEHKEAFVLTVLGLTIVGIVLVFTLGKKSKNEKEKTYEEYRKANNDKEYR